MKKLFMLLMIMCLTVPAHSREVTLAGWGSVPEYTLTLPDSGPVTFADLPEGLSTYVHELEEKIPTLSVPPRGKGVEVAGIYRCVSSLGDTDYFSVQQQPGGKLLVVNIDQDLIFLKDMILLNDTLIQEGVQPRLEEFAFWSIEPSLFKGSYSSGTYFIRAFIFPIITKDRTGLSGSIDPSVTKQRFQMYADFYYYEGKPVQMWISAANGGVFDGFKRRECPRIF